MTGLVRKATLMAACGLLVSAAAMASVPSPCNSTLCGIVLVGKVGSTVDPLGNFQFEIRDLANNPVSNSSVVIDFTNCCPEMSFATVQNGPGMVVVGKTVRGIANASGVVTFRLQGCGLNSTPLLTGCAKVYADGVLLTEGTCHNDLPVAPFDQNGAGAPTLAVGPADLAIWLSDFFLLTPPFGYEPRSDYDINSFPAVSTCTQAIGPADLAKWLGVFFGAQSTDMNANTECGL